MANAILIHGTYGSSEGNWFPWLKNELERIGFRVFVPDFPTPENQNLESWMKVFETYKRYLHEDAIMIGHSSGCAFILDVLERHQPRLEGVFLVSGFVGSLDNPKFDDLNRTICDRPFNWVEIRKSSKKFVMFASDNDPYVPLAKAEELKQRLNGELIIVKKAGHFNMDSGFKKFEKLLSKIKEKE